MSCPGFVDLKINTTVRCMDPGSGVVVDGVVEVVVDGVVVVIDPAFNQHDRKEHNLIFLVFSPICELHNKQAIRDI